MAAKEVIHFRLPAQLTSCSLFPVLLSIESVSESPSDRKIPEWGLSFSSEFRGYAIRMPRPMEWHSSGNGPSS